MPKYYEYEEYRRRPARSRSDSRERDDSPDGRDSMRLAPPVSNTRPRSVPPPNTTAVVRRGRSPSRSGSRSDSDSDSYPSRDRQVGRRGYSGSGDRRESDRDRDRDRDASPVSKARHVVQDNFTKTTTGIGAGLLGAVVGGFAARQASDAAARHRRKSGSHHQGHDDGDERTRAISTILGAVAGGLGANALANRVEGTRDREKEKVHSWESRHGLREDAGRSGDGDRRNGRGRRDYDDDDDEYDYVYDDRHYDDRRPSRRRSEENYRYRD